MFVLTMHTVEEGTEVVGVYTNLQDAIAFAKSELDAMARVSDEFDVNMVDFAVYEQKLDAAPTSGIAAWATFL